MATFTRPAGSVKVMVQIVRVTSAQVAAARLKIKRATAAGKPISPSVLAIANARRDSNRGANGGPAGV